MAVQKLESMRAEQGDPSVILQYFDNDGVNTGPLAGPLDDVAQKVGKIRVSHAHCNLMVHLMLGCGILQDCLRP